METPETALKTAQLPCRHLRCKEMFYGGSEEDDYAGGAYWCSLTQETMGPDGVPCGKKECCANRTCYVT